MSAPSQPTCLLCDAPLTATGAVGVWEHPVRSECLVRLADDHGVCTDDDYTVEAGEIYAVSARAVALATGRVIDPLLEGVARFAPMDVALGHVFDDAGAPRLGGASSDLGWSSFQTFMRCPYLWKKRYLTECQKPLLADEPLPLAVGSLFHTYLAVYYQRMIDAAYPLWPEKVRDGLVKHNADPAAMVEAWRLYAAYRSYYRDDKVRPLAVEYRLVDPRTGLSCRFDMIAELEETPQRRAGVYVVEHKSSARFTDETLTGWVNDGEVIGQIMLWKKLGLDKRFGALSGVVVNITGKQKVPLFHRTFVSVQRWQVEQHERDLQQFHALRQLYTTHGTFPRARANCISRFGKCDLWEHCATGEG